MFKRVLVLFLLLFQLISPQTKAMSFVPSQVSSLTVFIEFFILAFPALKHVERLLLEQNNPPDNQQVYSIEFSFNGIDTPDLIYVWVKLAAFPNLQDIRQLAGNNCSSSGDFVECLVDVSRSHIRIILPSIPFCANSLKRLDHKTFLLGYEPAEFSRDVNKFSSEVRYAKISEWWSDMGEEVETNMLRVMRRTGGGSGSDDDPNRKPKPPASFLPNIEFSFLFDPTMKAKVEEAFQNSELTDLIQRQIFANVNGIELSELNFWYLRQIYLMSVEDNTLSRRDTMDGKRRLKAVSHFWHVSRKRGSSLPYSRDHSRLSTASRSDIYSLSLTSELSSLVSQVQAPSSCVQSGRRRLDEIGRDWSSTSEGELSSDEGDEENQGEEKD